MHTIIFWAIILIIVVDFFAEQFLAFLNNTYRKKPLPVEAKGIYNEEEYARSQNYESDTFRFGVISSVFSTLVLLIFIIAGGFGFVDNMARILTEHPVFQALLFFGFITIASQLLSLPFSIYSTFVIEERYGFNKTTARTFVTDLLKSLLLLILIGAPLLGFIVWVFDNASPFMWVVAWAGISLFILVFNYFYSTLIVPLFNKQRPLDEGNLRSAIEDFAQKVNFKVSEIYVIDGSKRSSKANAYFAGFGAKKRIVLFDTLIDKLDENELVAVLAHEIGHYKKKHILKNMAFSILSLGVMLFLLSVFVGYPSFSLALGVEKPSIHAGMVSFGIIYGFISSFLGIFMNMYSRHNEYQADEFAVKNASKEGLKSALKKLSVTNLSNLQPHPWYVFVYYSHPPLLRRLAFIEEQD